MPDRRRHRGAHPADRRLFADAHVPALRSAADDLAWLLQRGYRETSALALVGNRHGLTARQRTAVLRSSCGDDDVADRRSRHLPITRGALGRRAVTIDGFNALITTEAALAGGVILRGRDGAHRDLASVHGSYRRVAETEKAALCIGERLADAACASITWLLDRPVSNSGRLRSLLLEVADHHGWPWSVELLQQPDRALVERGEVVATSDAGVLRRCGAWIDLPGAVIAASIPDAWLIDLRPT